MENLSTFSNAPEKEACTSVLLRESNVFREIAITGSEKPFTIAMMDINRFKRINDKYGHNGGDDILKAFARGFQSQICETDFFGRWGGDEFLLVCTNEDSNTRKS